MRVRMKVMREKRMTETRVTLTREPQRWKFRKPWGWAYPSIYPS